MELLQTTAIALLFASGAVIEDPVLRLALEESAALCAGMGGNALIVLDDAVTEIDLTGDGKPDRLLNEAGTFCAPDAGPLHAGSGGGRIHAIVDGLIQPIWGGAWTMAELVFDPEDDTRPATRALIVNLHGSACGAAGAAPCLQAFTWDGGRFVTPGAADAPLRYPDTRP